MTLLVRGVLVEVVMAELHLLMQQMEQTVLVVVVEVVL